MFVWQKRAALNSCTFHGKGQDWLQLLCAREVDDLEQSLHGHCPFLLPLQYPGRFFVLKHWSYHVRFFMTTCFITCAAEAFDISLWESWFSLCCSRGKQVELWISASVKEATVQYKCSSQTSQPSDFTGVFCLPMSELILCSTCCKTNPWILSWICHGHRAHRLWAWVVESQ